MLLKISIKLWLTEIQLAITGDWDPHIDPSIVNIDIDSRFRRRSKHPTIERICSSVQLIAVEVPVHPTAFCSGREDEKAESLSTRKETPNNQELIGGQVDLLGYDACKTAMESLRTCRAS